MEIFNENLSKLDTNNSETYILGDFNINLWQNSLYVFQKKQFAFYHSVLDDVKNYFDFYTIIGLKQLIVSPNRITCSSSSIIDHILQALAYEACHRTHTSLHTPKTLKTRKKSMSCLTQKASR